MRKAIIGAMLAIALSAVPAVARTAPVLPAAKEEIRLYGLPIFTSDDVEIGAVAETGTDDNGQLVLLAEIGRLLTLDMQTVAIPLELFVLRADRIDLFFTVTEVREKLSSVERDQRSVN